jgi:hypothetical protein
MRQRVYPLLAMLFLVLSMIACSNNGNTDQLNDVSRKRAWCSNSQSDVCVTP